VDIAALIDDWGDEDPPPPGFEDMCRKEAEAAIPQIDPEVWVIRGQWMERADKRMMVVALAVEHIGTGLLKKVRWSPFEKRWMLRLERGSYSRFD